MSSSDITPVWLDCDPGHDDAMAIILACYSPHIDLIGISTVYGNQTVEKTTLNAMRMLKAINKSNIEVIKGSQAPLLANTNKQICPEIHGESGLEMNNNLIKAQFESLCHPKDIVSYNQPIVSIYKSIAQYYKSNNNKKITICATGCLTNIALLIKVFYTDIISMVSKIVFMGGSHSSGNMTVSAEWNVLLDPYAVHILFHSNLTIIQIPIEISHQVLVTQYIRKQIKHELHDSKFSKLTIDLLQYFKQSYSDFFGFDDPPLHDPITICYCIDESLFRTKYVNVEIDTKSDINYGRTTVDFNKVSDRQPNVHIVTYINVDSFWNHQIDALKRANKVALFNSNHSKL